jgi:hypothetical protein
VFRGAFMRRIKYGYELSVKPQYRAHTGYLDMAKYHDEVMKCNAPDSECAFPFYIWELRKHDFNTGITDTEAVSLVSVMDAMILDIKGRVVMQKDFESGLDNYLKRITSQCGVSLDDFKFRKRVKKPSLVYLLKRHTEEWSDNVALVKPLLALAVMAGGCYAMWKITVSLCCAFQRMFGVAQNQSNRPAGHPMQIRASKITAQTGEEVANRAYCNTFKVTVRTNATVTPLGQMMMLNDKLGVQPYHFFNTIQQKLSDGLWKESDEVLMENAGNREHKFTMTIRQYLNLDVQTHRDYDVMFIKLRMARACKNISKMFIKETDLRHVAGNAGRVDVCELVNNKIVDPDRRLAHSFPSIAVGSDLPVENGSYKSTLVRHLRYKAKTRPGDCGAPITMVGNKSFQNRNLVGIHIAGLESAAEGYGAVVTQEMIDAAREYLGTLDDDFIEDVQSQSGVSMTITEELPFAEPGSFLPIGVLERPVVICPVSSYYKTWLYGVLGDYDYYPAPMSSVVIDGVVVHPLERALLPYATDLLVYEQPWLRQVCHVAMSKHRIITRDYSRDLYTFEEAILGIPEMKFRSIPRGTSAGFPFVYDHRNGKTDFFGYGDNYDLTSEHCDSLRKRVNDIISAAKDGVRKAHVFVDFPKDELRALKKVKAAATRLISASPLDYTIAWRMFFGAFCSATMKNNTVTGMAPGICTYAEWDKVVAMVRAPGGKVFAGDFKGFDSSEQPDILELFLEYVNDWYNDSEENKLVRQVLWADMTQSRHVGGLGKDQRFVYQWAKSLPSGHPFTTIVNSMYSLFCMVASYSVNTGDFVGFWDHCSSVVYGDDNLNGVSNDKVERYNQVTTEVVLREQFKLTYTADVKDGELKPYTDIEGTTFLKRGFIYDGRWLCPLALDSFLYTMYWCKNKRLEHVITCDVLETALEELSMHPPDVWDKYASQLRDLLARLGKDTKGHFSREAYQAIVTSRTDSWF